MTHLELLVYALRHGAVTGTEPTEVTGLTGEQNRMVDFVNEAWHFVQGTRNNWAWQRTQFTFNTIAATGVYTVTDLSLDDLIGSLVPDSFFLDDNSAPDDRILTYHRYEDWTRAHGYKELNSPSVDDNLPLHVVWRPDTNLAGDGQLYLYPTPDAIYPVVFTYFQAPQDMGIKTYVPPLPARFHAMIAWKAIALYAFDQGDQSMLAQAETRFSSYLKTMAKQELGELRFESSALGPTFGGEGALGSNGISGFPWPVW